MEIGSGTVPGISTQSPQGSVVTNSYVERTVTVYAIHEPEVDTLTTLNGLVNLFLVIGTLALSLPIGLSLNGLFSAPLPNTGQAIAVLWWIGVIAAGVCGLITVGAFWRRSSVWRKIKEQSQARAR